MTRFTTRVELYGEPPRETYELYKEMEEAGFSRTVLFGNVLHWLPKAEDTSEGEQTTQAVLQVAVQAGGQVWHDYAVMVTKTTETRRYYNLKPVEQC